MGNGTGRQVGDQDGDEDATPRTDLKKNSPAQRSALPLPCTLCTLCSTDDQRGEPLFSSNKALFSQICCSGM